MHLASFRIPRFPIPFLLVLLLHSISLPCHSQALLPVSGYRGLEMLGKIKRDLKAEYYDGNFHGMDVDARFEIARGRIKTARSNGQIYAILAQLLSELNDSHTVFQPPSWQLKVDYGFEMQHIDQDCYVTSVNPISDAGKQGLQIGDLILSIDGTTPSRENLWKIKYSYFTLQPRDGMTLEIRSPNKQDRTFRLKMRSIAGEELAREIERAAPKFRCGEVDTKVLVCKLPHFHFKNEEIDTVLKGIAGRSTLILDLRGNPGGLISTMQYFTGYFFKEEFVIAEQRERKNTVVITSKPHIKNTFDGKLIVLIDSSSASGAEVFARTIQLRRRGVVIGDRSAGKVMISRRFRYGFNRSIVDDFYHLGFGASITIADLVMPDKQSLERIGVIPDTIVLPTSQDLVVGRDPALSFAIELARGQSAPAQAVDQSTNLDAVTPPTRLSVREPPRRSSVTQSVLRLCGESVCSDYRGVLGAH